jgi:hypothetical protein
MKVAIRTAALAVILLIGVFGSSNAEPTPDAPTTGIELLTRVKGLVDRGQLSDPRAVLRVLPGDTPASSIYDPVTGATPQGTCNPGVQAGFKNTRVSFGRWFHNLPTGRPHLAYSAVGIFGNSGAYGDPAGSYLRMGEEYCSDVLHLREEVTATLSFGNLPGFSCLTMGDVSSVMPLTNDHATDGAQIYSYSPPAKRGYGARITFGFGGSQCLGGFDARQSQKWGTRYTQAAAAFRQCTDIADRTFCAAHPPFGWGDGAAQGRMSEWSAKQCKGFGHWYRRARTPDPALARPFRRHATPCDLG